MFNGLRNQTVFLGWWILWGCLHFWLLRSLDWDTTIALTESVVSTVLLSLFCFSLSFTMKYYRPTDIKVLYLILWAAILSLAWTYITRLVVFSLDNKAYNLFFDLTLPLRLITGLLVMSSFISILYVFFGQLSRQEQLKIKSDTEKLAKETELSALRDQLQPHFLFNTLNSIHALIISHPEQAQKMIIQLSDFLRFNLKTESNSFITFREELEHLSLYLDIEKIRFGHRLKVIIETADTTQDKKLPSLILQPLIENAIKYGLYDVLDDVQITLSSKIENGMLQIMITNPYDPEGRKGRKGTGFGQTSIRRRLFLLFGRQDLFKTEVSGNLYKVTLQLPQA